MINEKQIKSDLVRGRINEAIMVMEKTNSTITIEDIERIAVDTYNSTIMAMEHVLVEQF